MTNGNPPQLAQVSPKGEGRGDVESIGLFHRTQGQERSQPQKRMNRRFKAIRDSVAFFLLLPFTSGLYSIHLQTTLLSPRTQQQNITAFDSQVFLPCGREHVKLKPSFLGPISNFQERNTGWTSLGQVPRPSSIPSTICGEEEVGGEQIIWLKGQVRHPCWVRHYRSSHHTVPVLQLAFSSSK